MTTHFHLHHHQNKLLDNVRRAQCTVENAKNCKKSICGPRTIWTIAFLIVFTDQTFLTANKIKNPPTSDFSHCRYVFKAFQCISIRNMAGEINGERKELLPKYITLYSFSMNLYLLLFCFVLLCCFPYFTLIYLDK